MARENEQVAGQLHDPDQGQQQADSHEHGEPEAQQPAAGTLRFGQPAGQYRNENDVVDPEHDLEDRKRQKRHPHFRTGQEFHVQLLETAMSQFNHSPPRDRTNW